MRFAPLLLAVAAAAVSRACDTAEQLAVDAAMPFSSHNGQGSIVRNQGDLLRSAPLTLLPQDKGNESPACLDGSPYGFYFNK